MKKACKAFAAVLAAYLLLSLVASVAVSTTKSEKAYFWIIEHRAPLLLVSVDCVTPTENGYSPEFGFCGLDRFGGRVYGYGPEDVGREKTTVFAWTPFNNYTDGAFSRLDF